MILEMLFKLEISLLVDGESLLRTGFLSRVVAAASLN
jgi:hypothetical protein